MTNIDRAADVLRTARADRITLSPDAAARALSDAGLLAPDPQIIRTREELAALDPDTLLLPAYQFTNGWLTHYRKSVYRAADAQRLDLTWRGPAVVIATGDTVRAARQALEEA